MAVLVLEDLHGTIEAVVFPRIYERSLDMIREDAILILDGKVDARSDRTQLVVDRVDAWVPPPKGTPPPLPVAPPTPSAQKAVHGSNGMHTPVAEEVSEATESGAPRARGSNGNGSPTAEPNANTALRFEGAGSLTAEPNANGAHEKRVLRVVVPRGDDDNACVRVLEQLHGLVERFPGPDEIHLVLHDRA